MDITITRAAPDDAAEMVRVQIAAFHDDVNHYADATLGGPPGYDSVETMLRKIAEDECYVFRADGRVVGCMTFWKEGDGHYHLDVIVVDPAVHNQGIGSQAMRFLDTAYPDATRWTLDTPAYATRNHHFYEKFGYVRVREFAADDGFRLYAYERRRTNGAQAG